MKKKMKPSNIRATMPLIQEIEIIHRYDDEWKTNFITVYSSEHSPSTPNPKKISQELNICFNTKKEFEAFVSGLNALKKKFK